MDIAVMSFFDEMVKVSQGTILGINRFIIADIVPKIFIRAGVNG